MGLLDIPGISRRQADARYSKYANNTFVLFGDSRTNYNDTITATQHFRNSAGSFNFGNALAGRRAIVINNAGIGGNTTSQMLARIQTDVLDYRPAWCAVWGGINDITGGVISADTTIANLSAIFDALEAAGIGILAYTETFPAASGTLSASQKQAVFKINNWIFAQRSVRDKFYVVDACAATISASANPAVMKSAASRDNGSTGVHIGALGGYLVGVELAKVLRTIMPPNPCNLVSSAFDNYGASSLSTNLHDYGLFLASGGTAGTSVTGTVGNGMTLQRLAGSGAAVASLVARTDGIGQNQKMVITGATATDVFQLGVTGGITTSRFVNSGVYVASCEISVANPVNFNGARLRTLFTVAGTSYEFADLYPNLSVESGTGPDTGYTAVLETPPFTVPASGSITVSSAQVHVTFSGSSASADVEVGRMTFRKVG